ncbi:MAG: helix-turn-helix domain-containing protein [Clostridia bacterium]|nr:helix-turn-helix domain-containing protein [Clostridia bacterium]
MEWLSAIKKAISYIEENITSDVTIEEICKKVNISQFYFQRSFNILTGYTIAEYIRNRRLYLASLELIGSDNKIIDIAYKYGYETPESFTKAYTRFHGITPKEANKKRNMIKVFLPLTIKIDISGGETMDYVVEKMNEFTIIGFEYVVGFEEGYKVIPTYWDDVFKNHVKALIDGKKPKTAIEHAIIDNCIGEFGACIDDLGNGKFRYIIAGRYNGGNVPDNMVTYTFPSVEWAKFSARGPLPGSLQSINTKVFKEWVPGNPDYDIAADFNLEWYSPNGNPKDYDYESAVWLPVVKK